MSTVLTITAKGQVTLKRELLEHLGIGAGDKVVVDLLPSGRAELRPMKRGSIDAVFATVPSNGASVTIDDMNQVIAEGWASES